MQVMEKTEFQRNVEYAFRIQFLSDISKNIYRDTSSLRGFYQHFRLKYKKSKYLVYSSLLKYCWML